VEVVRFECLRGGQSADPPGNDCVKRTHLSAQNSRIFLLMARSSVSWGGWHAGSRGGTSSGVPIGKTTRGTASIPGTDRRRSLPAPKPQQALAPLGTQPSRDHCATESDSRATQRKSVKVRGRSRLAMVNAYQNPRFQFERQDNAGTFSGRLERLRCKATATPYRRANLLIDFTCGFAAMNVLSAKTRKQRFVRP
jgi:hypothetical protein